MPDPITRLVARGLAAQDRDAPHSLLTRVIISAIIVFAMLVLHGLYGVIGAVVLYLLGVELAGLDLRYWRNYGH